MRFATVNLGCKVNRVETDQAASLFLSCGFQEGALSDADIILINTCTVTGEAEKKTRKAVRQALRQNDHAQVIVTGCAAAIDASTYRDMSPLVEIVPKASLLSHLQSTYAPVSGCEAVLRAGDSFRTRVGIKVQDGCNNACTYCIVHVARGKSYSLGAQGIVDEAMQLASAGVKEIVLTGINLGTYRQQYDGREIFLSELLEELLLRTSHLASDGVAPRFRISSVEPRNVDQRLLEVIASSEGRICRHLHLPLQSGSSEVLRQMARPYTAEYFLDLVATMRDVIPGLALSTDIIAGFPGETDQDFQQTLEVARASRFMKIHAFPYSKRQGTPAALRQDQIDPLVKQHRAEQLRLLSDQLAQQDLASRRGTTEFALVEPGNVATLESYHVVDFNSEASVGSLVKWEL